MPGYLIWLNARLYEMKRLLKQTGNIYVHCNYYASHYIKIELDKIFGYDNFLNEVVWHYGSGGRSTNFFPRKHDVLLWYARNAAKKVFSGEAIGISRTQCAMCGSELSKKNNLKKNVDKDGRVYRTIKSGGKIYKYYDDEPTIPSDTWLGINHLQQKDPERIGYPTQKPKKLLERIIKSSSPKHGKVADFFSGGGTTVAVAQSLDRNWIACDQSRVAVAITADRLTRQVEEQTGQIFAVPDFTVEHWGVYEAQRLSSAPADQFRSFVLRCFGARDEDQEEGIHGYKGAIPVWVGEPNQKSAATAADVQMFANAVRSTLRYKQDNLRDGIMLAWAFRPDATVAAERLRKLENTDLNFIRLDMIRIDSPLFREHVAALSTDHADYENFLTFVQPPRVEVGYRRSAPLTYTFDASESIVMNSGAKIINVQWDFDYEERFSSTPKYSFVRKGQGKKEPVLQVQYVFPAKGSRWVACRVQDDMGGEGIWSAEIEVS